MKTKKFHFRKTPDQLHKELMHILKLSKCIKSCVNLMQLNCCFIAYMRFRRIGVGISFEQNVLGELEQMLIAKEKMILLENPGARMQAELKKYENKAKWEH